LQRVKEEEKNGSQKRGATKIETAKRTGANQLRGGIGCRPGSDFCSTKGENKGDVKKNGGKGRPTGKRKGEQGARVTGTKRPMMERGKEKKKGQFIKAGGSGQRQRERGW